ncbi:hypothetical protein Scep_017287 [Stephania cephalantha]|uniref:Uncharacterized protein n=1 Tax=Stephania cephalantha TaxID=152367 RepID=A0AAP0IPA9_9MAGN
MRKNEKKQSKNPRKHIWRRGYTWWQCGVLRHIVGKKCTTWESKASGKNESGGSVHLRRC